MSSGIVKSLLIVVSIVSVGLLAATIALGVLLGQANNDKTTNTPSILTTPSPTQPKICTTKACISAANLILNNINTKVDPCEDFNEFSCGMFQKRRIPSDATSTDVFSDLRVALSLAVADEIEQPIGAEDITATANAKKYYQSCIDEKTIEETGVKALLDVINTELGGWSLINPTYNQDSHTLVDKLVRLRKLNIQPVFSLYLEVNPKIPSQAILRLRQPGWFNTKQFYNNSKYEEAYKKYLSIVASSLDTSVTIDSNAIDRMFSLEKKFATYILTTDEKRNQTYSNFTLEKLNANLTGFDWVEFVKEGLFGDFPEVNVNVNETILVLDMPYLSKMLELLAETQTNAQTKKDFDNMMVWSFVKDRSSFLPKKYKDAKLDFDKVVIGSSSLPERSKSCANGILDIMPFAVGRLYVKNNFDESSKKAATEMIENIRSEFKVIVNELDWMDADSKKAAQDKADFIDPKIGYPDYTYNDTYLDILYENYNFDANTYLANAIQVRKADVIEEFSKLREPIDLKDWISGPAVVNAFYEPSFNQICFPAGILQAPFYDSNAPNYLNYGAIGSVIGHEITHGFDDEGRQYDKNGVFYQDDEVGLWTAQTIEEYKKKAQCIVDQYSGYKSPQVNLNLNGFATQGENIADNGGIKESFRAYQKWVAKNGPEPLLPGLNYTQEQLFYINWAQVWCLKTTDQAMESRIRTGVHSPGPFRTIGTTSNSNEFQKAFQCKPNQANNPNKKCAVW